MTMAHDVIDRPRPPSLQGRLLRYAAAVLAPVIVGALASGLILLHSAARAHELGDEVVAESASAVTLFESLEAARIAGSEYMEEGEHEELEDFEAASVGVERELVRMIFDEHDERSQLADVRIEWRSAVSQLRRTPTRISRTTDEAGDPEDVFEVRMNAAIADTERLVELTTSETFADLAHARRTHRNQVWIALAALLGSLVVAAFLARRASSGMVQPLRRLTRAAQAVGDGDLDHRVRVASSIEMQEMEDAFNRMASALQEQRDQLERQAFTDALTDIPNRALFEDRARQALERRAGTTERIAVLMLDIDDFKLVNDGLGHSCGDELIALAAARLDAAAREADTVARLGGDEFAVLLESVRGLDDAVGAAERFRHLFDSPFTLNGCDVVVSASIGVALSAGSLDSHELLRRADLAMYRVKDRGGNGTAYFDPAMEERAVERLDTLNALRKAVDGGELLAHFQPIVELASGQVAAAEALLRWDRPGHGLVPPLDFIPLAEESGLIVDLGAWILREACTRAREWRSAEAPDVRVTVNLSARQLLDPGFEQMVLDTLAETGLEPDALVLEVTESSLMMNADVTIPRLERLVECGLRVTLDDFGEGHSSLSHVRSLPIVGIKVARPFVKELADPEGDARLVRGIVELVHSLGLALVAEGIEEPVQHDELRALGCPFGQGFLFSRPLEAPALRELLRTRLPIA
jgi:diguanylate cyclase (GGDEF)-like protein